MYILIGILLGSIVTSTHDSREACEGRKTILAEKGVVAECKAINSSSGTLTGTSTRLCQVLTLDGKCAH